MKTRSWIKRLVLGAVSAGSSLVIAGCYGPMYEGSQGLVSGRVTFQGHGVPGMQVCAAPPSSSETCTTTDGNGYYSIIVPDMDFDQAYDHGFAVQVTDIDGEQNGLYEPAQVTVDPGNAPATVNVAVEEEVIDG